MEPSYLSWSNFVKDHGSSLLRRVGSSDSLSTSGRILFQCLFRELEERFWDGDGKPSVGMLKGPNMVVKFHQGGEDYWIESVTIREITHVRVYVEEGNFKGHELDSRPKDVAWVNELMVLGDRLTELFAHGSKVDQYLTHIQQLSNGNGLGEDLCANWSWRWQMVLDHPCTWEPYRSFHFITRLYSFYESPIDNSDDVMHLIENLPIDDDNMNNEEISTYLTTFFEDRETVKIAIKA